MRSKKPVWLLFKVLELVLSFCCCYIHWRCFQDEGIPHIFLLCASYGGSSIICVLSIVGMFYAEKPTMKLESVFSGLLGTLHLVTIFVHMYLALHGQKLLSMKARGESWHGFYVCCRDNSKVALYATAVYYLHCTFAMDLLLTHTAMFVECPDGTEMKRPRHPRRSMRPLKLYFISIGAENYLNRFRWFHLLTANMLMSTQPSQKTLDASSNSNEEVELAQQ